MPAQSFRLPDGAATTVPNTATKSPVKPLKTQWTAEVKPDNVLNDYPRPSFVRKNWTNLNGLWDFAANTANLSTQIHFDKKILVPFPPGSRLSGVPHTADRYVYHRKFVIPPDWNKTDHILLNFGASDWETTVRINGKNVGSHRGGYDPFSFDITDNLKQDAENELIVTVFDPTNRGQQPRGKQSETPSGVWYSAVTGIWQTVWLEPVPQNYIKSVKIAPDYDSASIEVSYEIQTSADTDQSQLILYAEILDGETAVAKCFGGSDGKLLIRLDKAIMKSWSPDSPFLYQVTIKLLNGRHVNDHAVSDADKIVDQIGSYFAFRKVERIREQNGHSRIWLNGKPLFQLGVIDQGYWSDGLYTAPTDTAIRMDIRVAKSLGFNVIRKYQKIEPERWYFWCDRLGVLVWQDMPSGENRSDEAQKQFQVELQRMLETLAVHPSIVLWTIFNEGAGQHAPAKYLELVKKIDPTRLVNLASGWTDSKIGDVNVSHKLPKIEMPSPDVNRVSVIGMYGGMTLIPPQENCWTSDIWGYLHVPDSETLLKNYREMQMTLRKMIAANGLAGAMFHQLTDVESECNGLTSYDRVILKIPVDEIEKLNKETIKQGSRL